MSTTGTAQVARIKGLDVLRGIAALTVVLSHYIPYWDRYIDDIPVLVPGAFGYYAVFLFFVISGIVIFNTLNKCHSVAHFAFLRFSRLYPAYWGSLLVVTLASFLIYAKPVWFGGLIVNATMFQEFLGFSNFDNVYWSLTAELAFYVHVAWLFALGWHRRVATICFVWLGLSCLWALFSGPAGNDRAGVALFFDFDLSGFFVIGIALYDAARNGVRSVTYALFAAALATLFVVKGPEGLAVGAAVLTLTWLAIFGRLDFLANRVTLWLGNISFSLYLVHRNLGYQLLPRLHEMGFGPIAAILICMGLALGLAAALTLLIERPALVVLRSHSPWRNRPRSVSRAPSRSWPALR